MSSQKILAETVGAFLAELLSPSRQKNGSQTAGFQVQQITNSDSVRVVWHGEGANYSTIYNLLGNLFADVLGAEARSLVEQTMSCVIVGLPSEPADLARLQRFNSSRH